MQEAADQRSAGRALVEVLAANGVRRIFGVPGESYLPVLEALAEPGAPEFIVCRHEGGATMMAEAHAKITGVPGVALVTRGPGSANAFSGLHVARQDSTPLLLLVGQVPCAMLGREAWQEVSDAWFAGVAKWCAHVTDAARLPELLERALLVAQSGRPGPVVLCLPEDMLYDPVEMWPPRAVRPARPAPDAVAMHAMQVLLRDARRPLMLLGGSGWTDEACARIQSFSEQACIPVACAFRRQDRFDNAHPNYVGEAGLGINPALRDRIRDADLVLAVGTRLGDIATSHYETLRVPHPVQQLVHVHGDADEIGAVYRPDVGICAGGVEFAAALAQPMCDATTHDGRRAWLEAARADYLRWSEPTRLPGPLQLGEIVAWLSSVLPEDAIVTNGAGNYTLWVQRFHRYRRLGGQLAPTSGSMGYGLPAAIAAKLAFPERTVVCFAGDGCLQMTGQELTTAVAYGAAVIVVVVNNASLGSIRMHQERVYGRRFGTDLHNPDFLALATAYGVDARRAEDLDGFVDSFERARGLGRPALIELRLDAAILKP
ncbi:MAG: thiamine pyrophosphate-binding protein [Azoarcus sp.]|nr:thiamine pyrophosphate-binding protein [Azoarcus sp.]